MKALQSIGYETIAAGDSYNDLGMIQASKAGFLFKSTEKIKADHPELPAYEEFDEHSAGVPSEAWPLLKCLRLLSTYRKTYQKGRCRQ